MKKNWKRLGSLVLALALLVSMIPLSASAEEMTQASLQEAKEAFKDDVQVSSVNKNTSAIAQIGDELYSDFVSALENVQSGETLTLLSDVVLGTKVVLTDKDFTLNMSGHKVIYSSVGNTVEQAGALIFSGTSNVMITGDGLFDYDDQYVSDDSKSTGRIFEVEKDAVLTIENGSYHAGLVCVLLDNNGKAIIEGGNFSATVPYDGKYWHLNRQDNTNGMFYVYGGTFENYDPSNSSTENPEDNFCAEGYTVISEEKLGKKYYTVVPEQTATFVAQIDSRKYKTLDAAVAAADAGDTIDLIGDVVTDAPVEINKGVVIRSSEDIDVTFTGPSGENLFRIKTDQPVEFIGVNGEAVNGRLMALDTHSPNVLLRDCTFYVKERGISFVQDGIAENASIILDNTKIRCTQSVAKDGNYNVQAAVGDYRGISIFDVKNSTISLKNNSELSGFGYCINATGTNGGAQIVDASGLVVNVENSLLRGWTGFNVWNSFAKYNIVDSTVLGINNSNGRSNSFSAITFNGDIYNQFDGLHAYANELYIKNSSIKNYQENQGIDLITEETLLRIDNGITKLTFAGNVTFEDTTGKLKTALDLESMEVEKQIPFVESIVYENGASVKCVSPDSKMILAPLAEASIGETKFPSISVAITAAKAGETVTLLKDTEVDQQIVIDEAITFDLGGHTLTNAYVATGSDEAKFSMITREDVIIQNGTYASTGEVTTERETRGIRASSGNLTLKNMTATCKGLNVCNYAPNSTLTIENATIQGDYAVSTFNNKVTVKITDSVLEGTTCGLYHNGSYYGLDLDVTDTTITGGNGESSAAGADDTTAVYISGSTMTTSNNGGKNQQARFTNCVVSGSTGIEVKYTDLELKDCTVSTTSTKEPTFDQFNNGSTTSGFSVVATDNSMEPEDPAPGGSVTITSGYYKGLVGLASFFEETNQYPNFKEATYTISNGYFTSDPSAYLAEGKIAVVSDKDGYNFTVVDKTTVAEVVVAEPEVPAPDFPEGDGRKELAQKVVEALVDPEVGGAAPPAIDETILTAAANEKANENTLETDDPVVTEALEKADIETGNKDITIVIQPYLEIVVKDVAAEESGDAAVLQAITLDVTPMYRTVATTADLSDPNAEIKLPSEDVKDPNAALIGEPKELTITKPVTVTIPLPSDFADNVSSMYVKHVKDNGRTYYYKGNVADDVLTFNNPNGFSLMTISAENEAVAEINGVGYGTLQEALADAADGDTVKILKDGLTASMSGSSRTIILENGVPSSAITVTINGEVLTIDKDGSKEYTYTRPGGGGTTEAEPFTDVDENDWFYDEVVYVYANGLMQGTSDTTFSPKNEMDRAMLVTTLYRMEGEPAVADVDVPFTDVTEGYYVDAVAWAYANDIVSGYENNTFQPKKAITREQYVTILHRYAQFKGMDVSSSGDLSAFTDADKVSGWAEKAMIWAVDTELMQGVTETTIAPRKTAQRCQGAALLARFHQMMA